MEYINFEHNETAAELVRAAYDTPPLSPLAIVPPVAINSSFFM